MKSVFEDNTKILMRDGVGLATSIWRPDEGEQVPALLLRSPYGRLDEQSHGMLPNMLALVRAGYAIVTQDVRGTFSSDSEFVPNLHDADDGEQTIRWLAEQPWCDGSVGMWGLSYLGLVQWQAAATGTPALKAIAPVVTSADLYCAPWYSPGGALSLHTVVYWSVVMALNAAVRKLPQGEADPADVAQLAAMLENIDAVLCEAPLIDKPLVTNYLPWLKDVFAHPTRDEFWVSQSSVDKAQQITTPALVISGWYDLFATQQLSDYVAMRERAGSESARNGQRLIVGPWSHSPIGFHGVFPDRDFGAQASAAAAQLTPAYIAFFDRWLKGREDALDGSSPVRIFVMGIDQWRDEQSWPLHDTQFVDYHLGGVGTANSADGAGLLVVTPATQDVADRYLYDPRRPVPSVGGNMLSSGFNGPADQSAVETREDILCFSSAVLEQAVEVTGPISLKLFVSSSAVDTDFTAKLVDVFPDGRVIPLCEGMQRMRYRKSLSEPKMMSPGEVYEITIDVGVTSNVFLAGHRIRLEVSSSNFPRYDRNSNTGGSISGEREAEMIVAVNSVYRGPSCPSRLVLPIIER